jgi:hypothetical protein
LRHYKKLTQNLLFLLEKQRRAQLNSLRAFVGIMNEIEKDLSTENVEEYLKEIHSTDFSEDVNYFLAESKNLSERAPKAIFVTNSVTEGQTLGPGSTIKDLWFFFDGYCTKVNNFAVSKKLEVIELIPLKGEVQKVRITKKDFRANDGPTIAAKPAPQLTVTVQRTGVEDDIELEAAQPFNCQALLKICKSYLTPLLLI